MARQQPKPKLRFIKPKTPTTSEPLSSKGSEIKLVPKWHIINTSRQNNLNTSSNVTLTTKKESSQGNVETILNENRSRGRLPSAPIQTLMPTSEPRKATLMTEEGPIDVSIIIV